MLKENKALLLKQLHSQTRFSEEKPDLSSKIHEVPIRIDKFLKERVVKSVRRQQVRDALVITIDFKGNIFCATTLSDDQSIYILQRTAAKLISYPSPHK